MKSKFPLPQYLGSKYKLLDWICDYIPKHTEYYVLDMFAGSQSVSYKLKEMGFGVICNDFMNYSHQIGLALIENNDIILSNDEINHLISIDSNSEVSPIKYELIQKTFNGLFFEFDDCVFLDNFRCNVDNLKCKYKKALALASMNRAMTRKVTMGHFAHTKAIEYSKNKDRIARNKSLATPVKDIWLNIIKDYNNAVVGVDTQCYSFNHNSLELFDKIPEEINKKITTVYLDPPYCGSHADYQSFYHLLETYTNYWRDMDFVNNIKRYNPQKFSGFDRKRDIIQSFDNLFQMIDHIPHWIISYNDRSYPSIDTLIQMIKKYREVEVESYEYKTSRGGKGSVKGSSEILLVCN